MGGAGICIQSQSVDVQALDASDLLRASTANEILEIVSERLHYMREILVN